MFLSRARADGIPFGPYRLHRRIGRGGMAEVWRATDARDGRAVAIKRILHELSHDPEFVAMFAHEAALGARLRHPGIVAVHEFAAVGGEWYIAMELLDGVNLTRVQRELRLVPFGLALHIAQKLALALGFAHALADEHGRPLGIIHRDVSPSNVMLTGDGRVKLLDFGIAKALNATDAVTRTGVLKGKLGYMAPERAEDREPDHRSDLFSVGVILHQLLTGKRLFRGRDEVHTMALVRECKVPPPSHARPELPFAVDRLCLRALARDPDARHQTGEELAAALAELAADAPWGERETAELIAGLVGEETPATHSLLPATVPHRARRRGRRALALSVGGVVALASAGAWWATRAPARAARATTTTTATASVAAFVAQPTPAPSAPPSGASAPPSTVAAADPATPTASTAARAPQRHESPARPRHAKHHAAPAHAAPATTAAPPDDGDLIKDFR